MLQIRLKTLNPNIGFWIKLQPNFISNLAPNQPPTEIHELDLVVNHLID